MRKLIAMVAVAAGLMLGSVANAAAVDIFLTQTGPTDWNLTMSNNGPGLGVAALQLRVIGLDTFTPNALLANISVPDSNITIDPISDGWNTVIVASTGTLVAIVPVGTLGALLGTLTGAGPVDAEGTEIALESATVYGAATGGPAIPDYAIHVVPTPTTPEPITMVLLGVGLAALGLVRRSA